MLPSSNAVVSRSIVFGLAPCAQVNCHIACVMSKQTTNAPSRIGCIFAVDFVPGFQS